MPTIDPTLTEPDGKWEFNGISTSYGAHALHTYVGSMIPALSRELVNMYSPKGGIVLDPFCGGGSVIAEAVANGRQAIGRDVNPLAVIIAAAKSTHMTAQEITDQANAVAAYATAYDGPPLQFPQNARVEYWFKPATMQPLTGLRRGLDSIAEPNAGTLLKAIFSATVRKVSLTKKGEIRLGRMPFEQVRRFNPNPIAEFNRIARIAAERIPQLPAGAASQVEAGSADNINLPASSVDSVICSPPYGDERNGVPYAQFSKNMLHWLGFSPQDINNAKSRSLGWGNWNRSIPPSETLAGALRDFTYSDEAVKEATAFYADYYSALQEIARVARYRIAIVIGNRVLRQTLLDNGVITIELMDSLGVPVIECHRRRLPGKRLPRMREAGGGIDQEYILIFDAEQ